MLQYDVDLTVADPTTSHGMMLELVGYNKVVLDIGCATGYLARSLIERGCRVSGVEVDEAAARVAAPVLDRLVVGDLASMDLVSEFGPAGFDTVVFGDVLEHLVDPLSTLRAALPLLRPGGSVVVSVPNISHASVRLSLLRGEFRYRDLGLLDRTHVHFFTRESLRQLLVEAGLVPIDMRRTTAPFFQTEIVLDPDDFHPSLIEELHRDPDADTYQFVLRAVVDDAERSTWDLADRNHALAQEVQRLHARVDGLTAAAGAVPPPVDTAPLHAALGAAREEIAGLRHHLGVTTNELLAATERGRQLEEQLAAPRALARLLVPATGRRLRAILSRDRVPPATAPTRAPAAPVAVAAAPAPATAVDTSRPAPPAQRQPG